MTAQLSLEDVARARDEAIQRVSANAGDEWVEQARAWLYGWLRTHGEYLPDTARVQSCPAPPNDWRAFGAVVRYAIGQGWMVRDGEAPRLSGHLSPGPKYRSLIFAGVPKGAA